MQTTLPPPAAPAPPPSPPPPANDGEVEDSDSDFVQVQGTDASHTPPPLPAPTPTLAGALTAGTLDEAPTISAPPPPSKKNESEEVIVPIAADAVRSIFLLTDGLANEGVTDAAQLERMLTKMLDHSVRPRIFTFGFGADHNPAFLETLANAGNGSYYFIESEERIPTAFADALGGLMSVVLQNIEVVLTPLNGCTIRKVHGTQTKRTSEYLRDRHERELLRLSLVYLIFISTFCFRFQI